jgi:twitching motility protein PilT
MESAKVKEVLDLEALLGKLMKYNASDILLTPGAPPSIRIDNKLTRPALPALSPVNCEMYAREIIPYSDWDEFLRKNENDLAVSFKNIGRFRVNIYRQRNSISIAMRPIRDGIPTFEELNLPAWLKDFAFKPQGLILVSGPAGHGKTTTLNALIDVINNNQQRNIISLEDPIEVMHKHKKSNINQREVGTDTKSFASGLRTVFRQSPDVIVVGEMRDKETFEIGLQAADTGHLVISSVHASSATSIFDRVINMFEPHMQPLIRTKLADCLQLALSQRLIPLKKGEGRILALEKLINSYRVKKFIKDSTTNRIRSQMQAGTEEFESIDMAIIKLYQRGLITFNDGLTYVEDEQFYRELTGVEK